MPRILIFGIDLTFELSHLELFALEKTLCLEKRRRTLALIDYLVGWLVGEGQGKIREENNVGNQGHVVSGKDRMAIFDFC